MDKIAAEVRLAEISGAVAAFVDQGLVKVASEEAFGMLVDDVNARLGNGDYDLQKIAMATDAAVADYAAYRGGLKKQAYLVDVHSEIAAQQAADAEARAAAEAAYARSFRGRVGRAARYVGDVAGRAARNPYVRGAALGLGGVGAGIGGSMLYDQYYGA